MSLTGFWMTVSDLRLIGSYRESRAEEASAPRRGGVHGYSIGVVVSRTVHFLLKERHGRKGSNKETYR